MQFSAFAIFSAALATLASAYTTPVGEPSGNAISKPGLNEVVPAGTAYPITWDPTTQGTVTLVLLRGPSDNVEPLYPIASGIPNTGSYLWTPSSSLEPDTTHYGIQLIVDSTGQYQYTTQFGISNPSFSSASASVSASATSLYEAAVSKVTSGSAAASATVVSATATANVTSTYCPPTSYGTAPVAGSTGYPAGNSSIIQPTVPLSVPATLKTSATGSSSTSTSTPLTGGAASKVISMGGMLAGVGAVVAIML